MLLKYLTQHVAPQIFLCLFIVLTQIIAVLAEFICFLVFVNSQARRRCAFIILGLILNIKLKNNMYMVNINII